MFYQKKDTRWAKTVDSGVSILWKRKDAMNLVFDLGGVVFTWNPEELIHELFHDRNARQRVREDIFQHADWAELDRGTLDREEAIQRAIRRTELPAADVAALMHRIPSLLVLIPETLNLLRYIKEKTTHKLFALSNMHVASIRHIEQSYDFWDLFDGRAISCLINMVKPEAEIYQYLLKRYQLQSSETLFIDDTQCNLDAAATVGIRTLLFQDPNQCESALAAMGILDHNY
jgi:putative hydrolase of the HAD superfamily